MPSEDQIRAEVLRIADGIDVDSEQHLAAVLAPTEKVGLARISGGSRRRRLLVPLAAAVSVAGVVTAGVALTGTFRSDDPDVDRPAPLVVGTPDGTVPSVFAQTRESAQALLEGLGLKVRFGREIGCEPEGRPIGTKPATGTPVKPGQTVTVLLSYQGPLTDCIDTFEEPWRFVDFATGRGPAPRFAEDVDLYVDGVRTETLSGTAAARGDWGAGSALEILGRATAEARRDGSSYRTPQLGAIEGTPPDTSCGIARPPAVGNREALTLSVEFGQVKPRPPCPARVALYRTADGAIDTVVAWSESGRSSTQEPIPDVVGLTLSEARDRVTAAGYPARVEESETCHPQPGVVEQAPAQQGQDEDRPDDPDWYGPIYLVVEVPHTTRDCAALDAAATSFLRFARGGPPPAWAPQVKQLFGYALWEAVTASRADDPAAWSFCSGTAPADCTLSPLVVAGRGDVKSDEYADVERLPDGEYCEFIDRGGLPNGLADDDEVVLYPAVVKSCDDDWSVSLWIDDDGRIKAVNLLVPTGSAQ